MGYRVKDILHNNASELLHLETQPGLGCTEPAAIGLCCAAAAELLPVREIDSIVVETNPKLFKNAMGVVIPNSRSERGIPLAAAMGAVAGDSSQKLQVFSSVVPEDLAKAKDLVARSKVSAGIASEGSGLFVSATIKGGGNEAQAVISDTHDNVHSLRLDGRSQQALMPKHDTGGGDRLSELESWLAGMNLAQLLEVLDELDSHDLDYIRQGLELNKALSEYGLTHGPCIGVGRSGSALIDEGLLKKEMASMAWIRAAAGIDSRMGGVALPAMTLAGSGNQGIAAGLPVLAVSESVPLDDETAALKAVTLSYLITCAIRTGVGRLSPLCGSGVAGGAGVAAATAYLLEGGVEQIGGAIKNHLENFATVICDGAKCSCALKVGEAVGSAVRSGLLARRGCVARTGDGIVDLTPEQTMANLSQITQKGLAGMDQALLDIMLPRCA